MSQAGPSVMIELTIDVLAAGGRGVGRHQGKAVFVPLTAPGDRVTCRVERDHRRYAEADLVDVVSPSPLRRAAPCPVFGACGGCQWQHLPYHVQVEWKERIFADQLIRGGQALRERIRPLLAAPAEWHYRSRVQLKCRQSAAGFVMGFYRRGSHFIIDIPACPISDPRLNRALALFREWLPAAPGADRIPQVDLAVDDAGRVRAVAHSLAERPSVLADYLRPLAEAAGIALFLQSGRKSTLTPVCGDEALVIAVDSPPLALAYGPGGFAQVNLAQNRTLVQTVLEALDWQGAERVLDLFCGMGNFSLPLARRVAAVTGVEDFLPSIAWARNNAARNGLTNADFQARPAEGALRDLFPQQPPDLVVLDPPRTGAYSVTRDLTGARPAHVLYISCDPATLARDLVPLLHGGYRLAWSQAIDLFPQTHHTESVTLLERME
jgi:23S rRNA (uracil1939-C5)-methyltransferase